MIARNSTFSEEHSAQQRWSMVEELNGDSNETGVQFLLMDVDLALTFMDVTNVAGDEETKQRNYANARAAFDNVSHLLERFTPSVSQKLIIDNKLAILKLRLLAVGQRF
ncbi:hypothetical protein [Terracidiphilus gabretensis]|jgi:hypothetical protein|uniref:hypothetical protein n=1 Tax=Terracidiphilus gabretensis TaxID=1577687 RepID=UPI00071B1952|nr:hypothetical protein [Terracidiphilus gabretensis]